MTRKLLCAAVTGLALLVGACGGASAQPASSPGGKLTGEVTILAAASLTGAFDRVAERFRARHPGLDVKLSYAGSQTLVNQIQQGAPADVFASADQPSMRKVVEAGLAARPPRIFARNKLQIAVPSGNPRKVRSLADLARPGTRLDLCAPAVPCGGYAAAVFAKAGVTVTPASQEDNVKAVVTKVSLGEADAGVVYATDVKAAGATVEGVQIPDDQNAIASYPVAELKDAQNQPAARAFVDYLLSGDGAKTLAGFGFLGAS